MRTSRLRRNCGTFRRKIVTSTLSDDGKWWNVTFASHREDAVFPTDIVREKLKEGSWISFDSWYGSIYSCTVGHIVNGVHYITDERGYSGTTNGG